MPHPNETDVERDARRKHQREADEAVAVDIMVSGLRAEYVDASPGSSGFVILRLGGSLTCVKVHGSIVDLRAVAQEIDRQLARLEVEHRIADAVEGGEG